ELAAPRTEPGGRLADRRALVLAEVAREGASHLHSLDGRRGRWIRGAPVEARNLEGGLDELAEVFEPRVVEQAVILEPVPGEGPSGQERELLGGRAREHVRSERDRRRFAQHVHDGLAG